MIAVVYRWKIRDGAEEQFREAWRQLTRSIHEVHGSLGSRLHQAADGTFVAYAQWPSEAQRQDAFSKPSANPQASVRLRQCIEHGFDELVLEVTDDLLDHARG